LKTLALVSLLSLGATQPSAEPSFEQRPEICQAGLMVDVTLGSDTDLRALVPAMEAMELSRLILTRPPTIEGHTQALEALAAANIELGLWLDWPRVPDDVSALPPTASWGRLRQDRREIRRALGQPPRAAGASHLPRDLEGSLEIFGFTLLLPAPDGLIQAPRRVVDLQGGEGAGLVLWPVQPLRKDGDLGPQGGLEALLDRTAAALAQGEHPVVRLSLPARTVVAQSELLETWRRQVLEPCGAEIYERTHAEEALRAWLRKQPRERGSAEPQTVAAVPVDTRSIDADTLSIAAEDLACSPAGATLPRRVADGLSLSETWLGFSLALAGASPPYTLHPVLPPQSSPRSVLPAKGANIPLEQLRASVAEIAPAPGQQLPSFVRIGAYGLTSAELLCAMAAGVRGQDPVHVSRSYSPNPFSPGLGWD